MPKVQVQLGDELYRIVVDGDETSEASEYGEPNIVEHGGQTYWTYADGPEEQADVYCGKLVPMTGADYIDTEFTEDDDGDPEPDGDEEEDVEIEQ